MSHLITPHLVHIVGLATAGVLVSLGIALRAAFPVTCPKRYPAGFAAAAVAIVLLNAELALVAASNQTLVGLHAVGYAIIMVVGVVEAARVYRNLHVNGLTQRVKAEINGDPPNDANGT